MAYDSATLNDIYDKTAGRCHLCGKKLAFTNYGRHGQRAAWEVDHSRPRARGGTDMFRNLLPACTGCNRSKQAGANRKIRIGFGLDRAPLSYDQRAAQRSRNIVAGAAVGAALAGPWGAVIGALLGSDARLD
jgi:hypothetical protein